MKAPKIILFISVVYLFLCCEQKTTWDLHEGTSVPVADCIITNEFKQHEMKLSWSAGNINELSEALTGATVEIYDGFETISYYEDPENPGTYLSELPFMASAGKNYRLTISHNATSDTAFASLSGIAPMEDFHAEPLNGYFHYIFNSGSGAQMLEVRYNWSADTAYCIQYGACEAKQVFYSIDNIDPGKTFAPKAEIILFPNNTQIIRRKYSLSSNHQEFIRSLLLETEWRGGIFDTEQGDVITNFSHGFRGWFGACMVIEDTVLFEQPAR